MLHYAIPEKNRYAYIMEGFDADWIECGNRRFATYTNLPAGEYTFKVKGSNCSGIWNTEPATLIICIKPPVWETWWFRIALTVAIIGTVVLVYRYRINRIIKQKRELEWQVKERTAEILEQKDDLAGQTQTVEQQRDEISTRKVQIAQLQRELEQTKNILEQQKDDLILQNEQIVILKNSLEYKTNDLKVLEKHKKC